MPAGGTKVKRVMTQAINLIFEFMKNVLPLTLVIYLTVSLLVIHLFHIIRYVERKSADLAI